MKMFGFFFYYLNEFGFFAKLFVVFEFKVNDLCVASIDLSNGIYVPFDTFPFYFTTWSLYRGVAEFVSIKSTTHLLK